METVKHLLAEKLLAVKAIKLQPEQPFTWASGWLSPFYCDNRKTLSFPDLRSFVKLELARVIAESYCARRVGGRLARSAFLLCAFQGKGSRHAEPD